MRHDLPAPADLHLHSTFSDGTEPPTEVVARAAEAGLKTIALTDHDTVAGWDEAARATRAAGLVLIPGIEVSAKHRGRSVHVLAYLPDPNAPELAGLMARVRDDRVGRAERIARNIARDYPVSWDDVLAQRTGDATVGRPHIADALIAAGVVASREEAFAAILHPAGPYYVGHDAPDPGEVVRAIGAAGGVSIIAHPAGRGMLPDDVIRALIGDGLGGFELEHRENSAAGVAHLRGFVDQHDLIVTGSSDYHGIAGKPNRPGENTTAPEMVERIVRAASGTDPVLP
ncbi:metal-dependent phosphoesterase [Microbacterium sorbitolivorans]|uniref:PHP domain-containing protein n=1 Tax=Microbacterium sorbitolivorans TaxID=1867410 RepID=UPI00199D4AEC|nr:PHP domain-containing protein [Microbacterium sorbitolivorans]GGF44167.1 metal-dependent phosphoesterase [Microbacterium sorbitolivorans]